MSKNGIGILLVLLAQVLGLDVNETEIQLFIQNSIEIIGFMLMVYNQLTRQDVQWGLWKTAPKEK